MQQDQSKPRNKELSNLQLQRLKKIPQFLRINSQEFILYNLVEKQSNSGLFKNQRLLILNIKQECLSYLSKVPPSLIPFYNEAQIVNQQHKQKLFTHQTYQNGQNKFSCKIITDKNGIEVKLGKNDRKIEWIYYFGTKQLMEQWYFHIIFLFTKTRVQIDQKYHRMPKKLQEKQRIQEKYDDIPMQNSEVRHQSMKESQKPSVKQSKPVIDSNINAQTIKSTSNIEKQKSEYDEFSQSAPLGKFIREDKQYNTQKEVKPDRQGKFYYTNPQNEKFGSALNTDQLHPKKQQGQNMPIVESNIKSLNNKSLSSHLLSQSKQPPQQDPISFRKKPQARQKDWNSLYYSTKDQQSKVYFDFVSQCMQYTTKLVEQLPVSKSIDHFEMHQQYYHVKENGITYKIAYGVEQKSFIYELSENSPIICENYDTYDDLKSDFFDQKQLFFKDADFQPPLICFIEYKGLSFLCKATKPQGSHQKTNKSFKRSNINEDSLLKKMQRLQLFIVSSADFQTIMRYLNTSSLNWGYLYHQTEIRPFKIQFLNEIFSDIFVNIIKGQLCNLYKSNLFEQFQESQSQVIQEVVTDSILMLVNRLVGKGKESDQLWDLIILQVQRKYKITTSTDSILPGYLLYSVIYKLGMYIKQRINMKTTFILFKKTNAIQKEHISGWKPKVYCLAYQQMTSLFVQIKENLQSTHENNEQLQMLINNEEYENIPSQIQYLSSKVNIQLSKTHPYTAQGENILIYQSLTTDIPTQDNYEIVLSAISWLLQSQRHNQAFDLAFIKIEELIFWTGKVPIISLIYDNFAEYFITQDNFDKAIQQLKLSIKTLTEIFGPDDEKLLKRKYDLSGYYLNLNRKEDSLKELSECKYLCESNKTVQGPIYIKILMKMAKLNLSMGKYNESVSMSMSCLKKLQFKDQNKEIFQSEAAACEFLQVGQLLLRSFQLSNRRDEVFQVLSLCSQRCLQVDSLKAYRRLFRILLFPYLKRLSLKQSQIYMLIVQQLNSTYKQSTLREDDLYQSIKGRRMLQDINERLKGYFKNVVKLYEEIVKRKLLEEYMGYYEEQLLGRDERSEVELFLKETFLVCNLIGIGFVQGMLKDVYYD